MMDVLLAKANPIISDCVMGELERLGPKYRLALRIARDPRWERLTCDHKGIYADDCIVNTVMKHRIYIIATNDKDLKNRVRRKYSPVGYPCPNKKLTSFCRYSWCPDHVSGQG